MIPVFLLSGIDDIPDVGDGNGGFSDISRNDEFPAVGRGWLENLLLLRHWERRIQTVNQIRFGNGLILIFFMHNLILFVALLVVMSVL
jgi:hypothetical protein